MPIVPTFQGGVPQVRDNGGSGLVPARAPAVNVDAYGRMMQQAMKPVDEWSNSLTEALRIEHQRTVKAESDDAERQVIDAISARMSGENGYMTQQGKNAMDAFQPTVEGITADVDKIVGSLQPQVREVVGSRIQDRLSSAVEQARRWNGQQTRAYHLQSSEARVQSLMTDADNHYAETAYLQKTWGSITQEIDYQAAMMGLPAEQVKLLKDKSYDLFTARRFEVWGSDNPVLALQAFKSQRPKVSADIAAKIESGLFSKSRDTLALGLAQRPVRYSTTEVFEEQDFTDQYNTQLTPEEEREFQAWAKAEGRERDVFNYDLRGAWKELKSGTMSEDARGHLGDKYKKPNHPTFSDQSIYSTEENRGGHWSVENGQDVFVPRRELSASEANYLQQYFAEREPGVQLKARVKDSGGAVVDDWYTNPSSLTGDPFIDSLKNDQRLSVVLRARQLRSQMIQMRGDEFKREVTNNLAETLMGNNPEALARDQFVEAYGPKRGAKEFEQYQLDRTENQFRNDAKFMSDADLMLTLKAAKPKQGSDNFASEMKSWASMQKAAQTIATERRKDKIGFALTNGYGGYQPINWGIQEQVRSQLEFRAQEMGTLAERWGGDKELFSSQEASDLVKTLDNGSVDERVALLRTIADSVGDAGIEVMTRQLKKGASNYAIAASAMDEFPDGAGVSLGEMYLRGKDAVDQKRVRLDETAVLGIQAQTFNALGASEDADAVFDDPQVLDATMELVTGVAGYKALSGGNVNDAIESSVGKIENHNGKKIVMPRSTNGWFGDDFDDLIVKKSEEVRKGKDSYYVGGIAYSAEKLASELPKMKLQTYGRLPDGGVSYLVLRNGQTVMNAKTNEPLILEVSGR